MMPTSTVCAVWAAWSLTGIRFRTVERSIWPTFFTGVNPAKHGQFFTHMQIERARIGS